MCKKDMEIDMQHGYGHVAWTWTYSMAEVIFHELHAAWM
jgi:hypothetical protein